MNHPSPRSLLAWPRRWWLTAALFVALASTATLVREWSAREQSEFLDRAGWGIYDLRLVSRGITRVTKLSLAPDGSLWVGTDSGLHVFDGHVWTTYLEISPPGWPVVYALAVDADGRTWVTSDLGLTLIQDGRERTIERYHTAMALATDRRGRAWTVGDFSSGISLLTADGLEPPIPEPSPSPRMSWVLAFDPEDHLWVDNMDAVWQFDGKSWSSFTPVPHLLIRTIAFDSEGAPWIGGSSPRQTACCTLASLGTAGWQEHHLPFPQPNNADVSALAFDQAHTLWVAFSLGPDQQIPGLASLRDNQWTFFQTRDAVDPLLAASPEVAAVLLDAEGHLFFGVGPSLVTFDLSGPLPSSDPVSDSVLTARRAANALTWALGVLGFLTACVAGWSSIINTQRGLAWAERLRERALSSSRRPRPSSVQSRSKAIWILSPGLCLIAWTFLSFMFWQGESSNLTHDGRPAFDTYAWLIAMSALVSLIIGAVAGTLAYYGVHAVNRRPTPTALALGVLALILGVLVFSALLAFTFYAFGMAATG